MPHDVRPLTPADQHAAWVLGSIAFGYRDRDMPDGWTSDSPGRHGWGVFDRDRLLAKAVDQEQGHWFGGRLVPASGVAGVATVAELRGQGLGRVLMTRLLAAVRDRGAMVSTLFPTTPFPYRNLGWEECGSLTRVAVPSATLAAIRVPDGVRVRPAVEADVRGLRELYREAIRDGTAVMDRGFAAWDLGDEAYLAQYDGVSVAEDAAGDLVGYMNWDRGPGYDATGRVDVDDFVTVTAAATEALLAVLGGWASVARTIVVKVSGVDPLALSSAVRHAPVHDNSPWMLRLVDAAGAVAARGWPPALAGAVDVDLVDRECPWNAGPHRLVLSGGEARLESGGSGLFRLPPRGLALWYAGAATPRVLRRAGLLTGGDDRGDALLRQATAGPAPVLLDYF